MYIPFLGRLRVWEWPVLLFSVVLVLMESLIATITAQLPAPLIKAFDWMTRKLWRLLTGVTLRSTRKLPNSGDNDGLMELSGGVVATPAASPAVDENDVDNSNELAGDLYRPGCGFVQMCANFGYIAEEHIVRTQDDYLLGVFRILPRNRTTVETHSRPVVYLHHGLLMNSEVWVTNLEQRNCIPFVLTDAGYDVWLGNNRGNKYSKKHLKLDSNGRDFWNFCLDEFALFDIPDTINYILSTTKQAQLSYIGFSQGSAQAFAALALDPQLNRKVNTVIALAPALSPPGLNNQIVDTFMKASPSLFFLIFGHRILLPSATFWQSLIYPPLFVRLIDASISFLFDWKSKNISLEQRRVSYRHLYSYTSVKSIVHWFQIMRRAEFNMYDDAILGPRESRWSKFYKVASFPTKNIKCPIYLVYGTVDSLVDINTMLSQLPTKPKQVQAVGINDYEHLDIIWSDKVFEDVMPHVLANLATVSSTNANRSLSVPVIDTIPAAPLVVTKPIDTSEVSSEVPSEVPSEFEEFDNDTAHEGNKHTYLPASTTPRNRTTSLFSKGTGSNGSYGHAMSHVTPEVVSTMAVPVMQNNSPISRLSAQLEQSNSSAIYKTMSPASSMATSRSTSPSVSSKSKSPSLRSSSKLNYWRDTGDLITSPTFADMIDHNIVQVDAKSDTTI